MLFIADNWSDNSLRSMQVGSEYMYIDSSEFFVKMRIYVRLAVGLAVGQMLKRQLMYCT